MCGFKSTMEFFSKYIDSFYDKVHSPPYCCSVLLEIRVWISSNYLKIYDRICRCFQKKYIVLGTTALSMLLALNLAIILTINVFHITSTRHLHNDHYHGDDKKSAASAEMYQKASIASDSGYCSEVGK